MRRSRLWAWFFPLATSVSVRFKIMGIVLVLTLILGLGITFQTRDSLATTLTGEMEKYGVALAGDLAGHSTDPILTGNSFDLYQLLKTLVDQNRDVRYAFIQRPDGSVLSHVFVEGFPVGLAAANRLPPDAPFNVEVLETDEGLVWDVAVPVFRGVAGVARLGISERRLVQTVGTTTGRMLIYTGIVAFMGLVAAYLLTSVLTRPIVELVGVTRAIARGDLRRKAPVWAADEIGRLGVAFNVMTEALAKSHDETEAFQRELLRRNRELSALNDIAAEVSRPQGLTNMMSGSLGRLLDATDWNAGWVSTLTADGEKATLVCQRGLSDDMARRVATLTLSSCACGAAVVQKKPVVIEAGQAGCPLLGGPLSNGEAISCHAAVPLISKLQVIGLLCVARSATASFTTEDLELLEAVAHQMGVAVENERLWEELKRREELRGRLLKVTISAQEAERKRIARELHDQTSQSLTALMVGLKTMEMQAPAAMQKNIAELRQLTNRTLEEVHSLALELRPSSLDDLGLTAAIRQQTRDFGKRFGIEGSFQAMGFDGVRLPSQTEIALYRIIQEALTNVAKHSQAKKVSVVMEVRGATIVAIVEDDGKGFDVRNVLASKEDARRLGLYGMQERATLIGGVLTIESTPDAGTTVFIEVPLEREKAE